MSYIVCIEVEKGIPNVVLVSEEVEVLMRNLDKGDKPFTNDEFNELMVGTFEGVDETTETVEEVIFEDVSERRN